MGIILLNVNVEQWYHLSLLLYNNFREGLASDIGWDKRDIWTVIKEIELEEPLSDMIISWECQESNKNFINKCNGDMDY